jgi:hypothetical protein
MEENRIPKKVSYIYLETRRLEIDQKIGDKMK